MKRANVLIKAQEAFWNVIAASHPEVTSGDFPPEADLRFDKACEEAYHTWKHFNK